MKHFFLPNLGISSKMKIGEISPKEKEGDFLFKKKKKRFSISRFEYSYFGFLLQERKEKKI